MTGVQHEIKTDPFYFSIVVQDHSLTEHDLSVHVKEKRFIFVIFDQNALALPLKQLFFSAGMFGFFGKIGEIAIYTLFHYWLGQYS